MPNNTENVTTKFKVDISDLKKNIAEANRQIKLANAEFKNATAGMDKWSDSADGLTAKIEQQTKIVDAEKSKLDALKQQLDRLNKSQENGEKIISDLTAKYDVAAKEYGENSDEAKKYAKQLVDAQAAQERNAKAADDLRLKIINQDTAVKNASAQVNKYENALNDLENELRDGENAAEADANAMKTLGDNTDKAANDAKNAGSGGFTVFKGVLSNLTTQVISECVDALKDMSKQLVSVVTDTAAAGDNIDKMSQKIGISAESFQEWSYVFERSGANIDGLEAGMKKLSTVITDAGNGSKSAAEALKSVGLSVDDLNGKSQDEQLSIVIGKLQEMESGSERTAAASKLLGRSATDLGAVLNMTAQETDALKTEAHEYGMVMSDDAVKSSAAFEDSLTRLNGTVNGVKNSIGAELLPEITNGMDIIAAAITGKKGVDGIISDVEKIVDRNLPKLLKGLTKAGKGVSTLIRKGLPKIVKLIKDIAPSVVSAAGEIAVQLIAALLSSTPDLVRAILSIVTNLLSTLTREFPNIINALVEIVPELIAALTDPKTMSELLNGAVTLLMAIVDAIPVIINALLPQIPVIVDNVCKILIDNTPVLLAASVELFMTLVQAIPAVIMELIPALGGILQAVYDNFIAPVKTKFAALWEDIKMIFTPAAKWFKQKFTAAYTAIKTAFANIGAFFKARWNDIKNAFGNVKTWFEDKFSAAWTAIKGVFENVGEFFGGIWDIIKEKFTTVGTDVGDAIGGAFKTAINAVIETVENALNAIPSAINGMIDEINKLPGVEIDTIPTVSLPRLAKGGIVDRATLAEIGEKGAEAIIPLERNKAGLKKIAALIADEIGTGALGAGSIKGGNVYNFTQTNNSPKSLSRYEIYRQTKNLINAAKMGVV